MTTRPAFAVLVAGGLTPPFGDQVTAIAPIIEEGHRRGLDVGIFDLNTLLDPDDAPGVWFAVEATEGRAGHFAVPHVVHDRHLGGVAGDHRRRLRLAETRHVFNSPALQMLTVDKLTTGTLLRDAGIPVPVEVSERALTWSATIDKRRYGRRGDGLHLDPGGPRGWVRRRRRRQGCGDDTQRMRERYVEPVAFRGRHPHLKLHVQRDGDGTLVVAGSVVRFSLDEDPPSENLLMGFAPVVDYEAVVDPTIIHGRLIDAAETLALRAASIIERFDPSVFELGVDIVVGRREGLVVIEVNSKPGRLSFRNIVEMTELPADVRAEARHLEHESFRRVVDEVERRLG